MRVDLKQFLDDANVDDSFYPGKRIVKPCKQTGEYKSHCVVLDWRDPDMIRIEIKAGLSGNHLAPENLRRYPVCFQMPTYVDIKVTNDNDSDDEDDEDEKGKSSGGKSGGRRPEQKKRLEDIAMIAGQFGSSAEGKIPSGGRIVEMMVMGVKMAKEAFGTAFSELTRQISHAKVSATELLAKTSDMVKRVAPPSFITPKGDETEKYKYDREKNADIGMRRPSLG